MASQLRARLLLLAAPLSAVLVVVLGVVAGGARPIRSARVYSGPTQGLTELSLRIEVGERDRVAEVPVPDAPLEVVAVEGGQRVAQVAARTDSLGMTEVHLRLPRPRDSAIELRVEPGAGVGAPLARGLVLGRVEALRRAPRRGGFQSGRNTGQLELAVAPAHGVLVTAQGALDDELVLRARRAGAAVADAEIQVGLEGGEPSHARVKTDASGLARLRVRPQETSLRVTLTASAVGMEKSTLATRFEVVQGAIRALRRGDELLLESSGAANEAYLAFFDEQRRYLGLRVALAPMPDGRLAAELPLPGGLPAGPLWAVTSSQADLGSPSAVGWPLASAEPDPRTLDARELLLLDGAPLARLREDKRVRRIRLVTAGYGLAALVVTLALFLQRVRRAERDIRRHLTESGIEGADASIAPAAAGRTLLAASCIGLGFVVVTLWALLKD